MEIIDNMQNICNNRIESYLGGDTDGLRIRNTTDARTQTCKEGMYMKRMISLVAMLLVPVFLLCACVGVPKQPDNNTTGSTKTSSTDSAATSTTGAEINEDTASTDGQDAPAVLNTEEDFQEFIKSNQWYLRALGCIFEKPEEIPAEFYFYNGVGSNEQATDEELAFIIDAYKKKNPNSSNEAYAHNYIRLPVAKMNEALSILGVTVADMQIPDHWAYYDKLDAYYFWASDAYGVTGWSVTKVEKGTEGIVAVHWKTKGPYWGDPAMEEPLKDPKMVMTMQLQPDDTYRILSNLPQE